MHRECYASGPAAAMLSALLLALVLLHPGITVARVLHVGPQAALRVPSQAATIAVDGDEVMIDPGVYADCAIWRASNLTIAATGPGVILDEKTCLGRGIFITIGSNITIRGLGFAHAHNSAHTGAGIDAFGDNLTIEDSWFINNENGILAAGSGNSVVRVLDSRFRGNGSCEGACAHALYAGAAIRLLDVERCVFADTRVAHNVKSRARNTIVIGNRIEDGPKGTSSYLIDVPIGGNVLIQDNTLEKGPQSDNQQTAISLGEESGEPNPTAVLLVRDNSFSGDQPGATVFVRNRTETPAALIGNQLRGRVIPLSGPGTVLP